MRNHQPVVIGDFNGLYVRGNSYECPPDHFSDCNNIQYTDGGFQTRDGLDTYLARGPVLRMYTYVMENNGYTLLLLGTNGEIFHFIPILNTLYGPILQVDGMIDFAFVQFNGRAYLSPHNGATGLDNEFVYVYKGDGSQARKAGTPVTTGTMTAANGAAGNVEAGYHVFGVLFETDTGALGTIGAQVAINATGGFKVNLGAIPVAAGTFVVARRIVATKAIDPAYFTGDLNGYEFFFVPDGRIADNTTTTLAVSFFDADLLDSADELLDLFTEIAAGAGLNVYHNRLLVWAEFDNISLVRVSAAGEPESINQINGLLEPPLDGKPITFCQEFRDVLYVMKETKTLAYTDPGDVPSSWPFTILEQGLGCSVHGIATVLDSGGVDIDYLIMVNFAGIMLFNGSFFRPELSYKIKDLWLEVGGPFPLSELKRDTFRLIQIYNDTIGQMIYITLPNKRILIGDYTQGLTPKDIKWGMWSFDINTTTITLIDNTRLLIGSTSVLS